jgi:molybdopterin converting factor small subunit
LNELVRRYPEVKSELFDKRGNLHGYVELYLNGASAYPNELKRAVKDGDEVSVIVMAVGG